LRLEGKELTERILVVFGDDGQYYAFKNSCTHAGRRLDPIPGTNKVQCCSVGKSTFDYEGKKQSGSAEHDVHTYPVSKENDPEVLVKASSLLIIAAVFQMFDGTQAVGIGILRGIADMRIPTIITFIAYWIIGLPGGYMLGFYFDMGVEGVWIALALSLIFSAIMLSFRFNNRSKKEIIV